MAVTTLILLKKTTENEDAIFATLTSQSFGFERTWWRLFQKRVVCTKLDIYVFINILRSTITKNMK
jgi:hypothetical protein